MADRRRQEIEAKRAKLVELRNARANRQRLENERRNSDSPSQASAPSNSRRDVDDLVNALVGNRSLSGSNLDSGSELTPSSSMPGTPALGHTITLPPAHPPVSGRVSRQSDLMGERVMATMGVGGSSHHPGSTDHVIERSMTPRTFPDLIDIEQELFELPHKERVIYNKEVQTATFEVEPSQDYEQELRQRILRERDLEAERLARDKELEEESVKLEQEIEQEIRDLSEEERASILAAPEFLDFVEQSSKIVQRALNDGYDYIRDYTIGAESGGDDSEGKRVKRVCEFWDERYGKNRSITDIDWSPKYPELSVASYNKNPAALNEPDGIVAVWNLHLLERPEFVFHSQSDVLSVTFSPFHSNLIFGGTYSGQILLWDTRSKHLPVLKTPLSAAGHTHPVYAMQMVGTQNAHNLITSSTDGTVCSWLVDMLAQPQETLELIHTGHNKTNEVAITTLAFPSNETTTFFVGTEEGTVYQANRYDRAGAKAGLNQWDAYKAHAGPVTALDFHPLMGPVDFGDLFLTSSVDWTVKLWRAKSLVKVGVPGAGGGGGAAGPGGAGVAGAGVGGSVGGPVPGAGGGVGAGGPGAGGMGGVAQVVPPVYSFEEADDYVYDVRWHPSHPAIFGSVDGSGRFDLWNLNVDTEVPVVSTVVGSGRAINKLRWDRKEGRRAALGGSDGRLYIYDIGDMALPRESEWLDLQKTIASLAGGGTSSGGGGTGGAAGGAAQSGGFDAEAARILAGR